MPIASLNRFTVPLSTDQSSAVQGLLMPKLKYRFRVTLDGFGVAGTPSTELTKQVVSVDRPNVTFDPITLNVYNSTVKMAGRPKFPDAKLTLRDDVTGAVTSKVGEQLQKQFDFYEQSSAASGVDYKFRMRVEILDGGNGAYEPSSLESFEFLGCFLSNVTYTSGEYTSNEPMQIDLTISYDNAIQLNRPGGEREGLGVDVGRTIRTLAVGG
jgi:hypothetical protein